jgi:hypothetical protein
MSTNRLGEHTTITEEETSAGLVPPNETFWRRYSAHQELPLSLSSSGFVHVLVVGLLVLGGIMAARWTTPGLPEIDAVEVGKGGGRPDGALDPAQGSNPQEALPQDIAGSEAGTVPALTTPPLKPVEPALPPLIGQKPDQRSFENEPSEPDTQSSERCIKEARAWTWLDAERWKGRRPRTSGRTAQYPSATPAPLGHDLQHS